MKKRGIFSLVVLLALSPLFAAQTTADIGTAYELVITDVAPTQAETNNSSSVSVITRAQIEAYNTQSTGELINKAIGTSFNSYGSLGASQTVVIRGASSSKNLIFLDGVLLTTAYEGTIDLSLIPVSTIEHIEIVKSGSGNLGRTNAIGGMINIITKRGEATETPFSVTVENGSFLPEAYGSSDARNWLSLIDSQKVDVTYTNSLQETSLVANVGGVVAQNAYTYDNGTSVKELRDNAQVYAVHGGVNASRAFGENIDFSSNNLANYQHLGVPGSYPIFLSANNVQTDMYFSTKNSIAFATLGNNLASLQVDLNYAYGRTFFDASWGKSTHNKNKGTLQVEGTWDFGETYNIVTGADLALDYVDSTNVGKKLRFTPALYAYGSIYFLDGTISLHPNINIAFISDRKALSPNASLGAIYTIGDTSALKTNMSYAENPPDFSRLFFEPMNNENLETEKGIQGDFGFSTKLSPVTYEGTIFVRNIYNEIVNDSSYIPYNIGHTVYLGKKHFRTPKCPKKRNRTPDLRFQAYCWCLSGVYIY